MKGNLYLVATPIGNLNDITLRAIKTLEMVDLIAAEDTRHSIKLLNHLNISKPLISYHRHNETHRGNIILDKLNEGQNVALISDAGTPAISDPGEEIVRLAIEKEIKVIPIPGASALITGLIASGLSTKEFNFIGFLSINKKIRKEMLKEIKFKKETLILYEAPHKIIATVKDLKEILGDRKIVLCRELTKIHEEFIRGNLFDIEDKLQNIKGEFVIIIEGNQGNIIENENIIDSLNDMDINEHFKYYESKGLNKKDAIKQIAKDRELPKNEVYRKFIE